MLLSSDPEPSILYKYRDDSTRTEEIFQSRKVWLALPEQLNDPLECQTGEIPEDWKKATIRKMEDGQLLGMAGAFPGVVLPKTLFSLNGRQTNRWWKRFRSLTHRQKMAAMRTLYADHGIQLSRPEEIFDDMRRRLSEVGVLSLSECCDNELMWAHYGGSHRGLAIGFKRKSDCKLGNQRHTLKVSYTDKKPTFASGFRSELTIYAGLNGGTSSENRVSFEDEVFRASLSTKTSAWGYEREWRYVEESHGMFSWPGELEVVVFGLRMSSDRREYYKRLIESALGHPIQYWEVRQTSSPSGLEIGRLYTCKERD